VKTDIGSQATLIYWAVVRPKGTPGMVIYLCCEGCAAKVRADPMTYAYKAIAEHNGWERNVAKTISLEQTSSK